MTATEALLHAKLMAKNLDRAIYIIETNAERYGLFDSPPPSTLYAVARIYPGGREEVVERFGDKLDKEKLEGKK